VRLVIFLRGGAKGIKWHKLYRMHPVVYKILDYLYYDRQHYTFDVQLYCIILYCAKYK
jgi:hypothetical protein